MNNNKNNKNNNDKHDQCFCAIINQQIILIISKIV